MPPLDNKRHETVARALVAGLSPKTAYQIGGYGRPAGGAVPLAERPDVTARVAELKDERAGGDSPEIGPVIDELMRLAKISGKLGSAAGMVAARGLLAEAAKLKGLLGEPTRARAPGSTALEPLMTVDEWIATLPPQP